MNQMVALARDRFWNSLGSRSGRPNEQVDQVIASIVEESRRSRDGEYAPRAGVRRGSGFACHPNCRSDAIVEMRRGAKIGSALFDRCPQRLKVRVGLRACRTLLKMLVDFHTLRQIQLVV